MNLDVDGLRTIHTEALTIRPLFENAYHTIATLSAPTGSASGYISSIQENLRICLGEVDSLVEQINLFIQELKEVNMSTEKEVENVGAGFWNDLKTGIGSFFGNIGDSIENAVDGWVLDTSANIMGGIQSLRALADLIGAEKAAEYLDNMTEETAEKAIEIAIEQDTKAKAGKTVVNSIIAGLKGIVRVGEATLDSLAMTGATNTNQKLTLMAYLVGLFSEDGKNAILNKVEEGRKTVMEEVEYNFTEETFIKAYESDILKNINEGAFIKHGDQIFMFIEGVAQCVPIATAMAVSPALGTALAYTTGSGKAQQETLTNMKNNSKEGIRSEHAKGNISDEELAIYEYYWNMSDEGLYRLRQANAYGKISDEQLAAINEIINMEEEWTTNKNMQKSNLIGTANGAWEAVQWYLGKGLNELKTLGGSKFLASLARVGIDTVFNGLDTPFRSLANSIVLGTDYNEEFEDRDGWLGIGIGLGVGLFGSLLGELIDWKKPTLETGAGNVETALEDMNTKLKTIINSSDYNKSNLKEGIIDTIPPELDDLTKARLIYLKLNQTVSYSEQWWLAMEGLTEETADNIFYADFDIKNMPSDKVVCSNWSKIYAELLEEGGIDASKIEIVGQGRGITHNWVKVDLGDGTVLLADATNPFNGTNDLANVKMGASTSGFIVTTEERFNQVWASTKDKVRNGEIKGRGVQLPTFEELSGDADVKLKLEELDNKTGYSDNSYLHEIEQAFSSPEKIKIDEKIEMFVNFVNEKDYSVLETCEFARKHAKEVLGEDVILSVEKKQGEFIANIRIKQGDETIILRKINDMELEIVR